MCVCVCTCVCARLQMWMLLHALGYTSSTLHVLLIAVSVDRISAAHESLHHASAPSTNVFLLGQLGKALIIID